uniref:Uncharacterized protein n=1 Tax=Lepisosteus oculatus TaxID=7918 RepID=W5LYU9_LEPOC
MYQHPHTIESHRLHVLVTGTTMGVQATFLGKLLQRIRFSAVTSTEHCDVIIAFCPVSSRIGTDIDDALNKISEFKYHKPAILVVLHHTPYLDSIVAPSRRLVNKSNILGTVDCLFHEEYFHNCEMNRQALNSVYTMLDNM